MGAGAPNICHQHLAPLRARLPHPKEKSTHTKNCSKTKFWNSLFFYTHFKLIGNTFSPTLNPCRSINQYIIAQTPSYDVFDPFCLVDNQSISLTISKLPRGKDVWTLFGAFFVKSASVEDDWVCRWSYTYTELYCAMCAFSR